jgi:hypothetical protein
LTVRQYQNTLVDLFARVPGFDPIATSSAGFQALPADDAGSTFAGLDSRVSDMHVEAFYLVADALASAISLNDAQLGAVVTSSCALEGSPTGSCVDRFLDGFAVRALRRPLVPAERTRYAALNDGTRSGPELFRSLILSVLLAPEFLYRVEVDGLPSTSAPEQLQLDPYELASRLSYHFWQSMPDDALFQAAQDGSILTDDGYKAQVDRVFADPKTKKSVDLFYTEWFQLGAITFRPSTAFNNFVQGTGITGTGSDYLAAAAQEISDLAAHFTWESPGKFSDLLLTDLVFTRSPLLAAIYGVPAWDGVSERPHLPGDQRSGILTRASFLLSGTYTTQPIHRGAVVRKRLLCAQIIQPDPTKFPPGTFDPPPASPNQTTRTRYENKVMNQPCAGCHIQMNPIGYVLERYDAIGRYRTMEQIYDEVTGAQVNSLPIDSSAVPMINPGDQTTVDSGPALSQLVAASGQGEPCFARQYFRFAYERLETQDDSCALEDVRVALTQGNLPAALKAVALSPAFKQRRVQ